MYIQISGNERGRHLAITAPPEKRAVPKPHRLALLPNPLALADGQSMASQAAIRRIGQSEPSAAPQPCVFFRPDVLTHPTLGLRPPTAQTPLLVEWSQSFFLLFFFPEVSLSRKIPHFLPTQTCDVTPKVNE